MEEGVDEMTDEQKQSVIESGIRVAERLGISVAILAVILWMTREAAVSIHSTVVIPIVKSHTDFLETTSETLSEISKTQSKQAEALQELAVGQRDIHHAVIRSGTKAQVD